MAGQNPHGRATERHGGTCSLVPACLLLPGARKTWCPVIGRPCRCWSAPSPYSSPPLPSPRAPSPGEDLPWSRAGTRADPRLPRREDGPALPGLQRRCEQEAHGLLQGVQGRRRQVLLHGGSGWRPGDGLPQGQRGLTEQGLQERLGEVEGQEEGRHEVGVPSPEARAQRDARALWICGSRMSRT